MKTKLLIIPVIVALLGACSTAYKTGQTPDDVYYSPARTIVAVAYQTEDRDQAYRDSYQDNVIRMGISNYRWRFFDDDYGYNPYQYGYTSGYYYNPFYCPHPVYNYWCYPTYYHSNTHYFVTPVNTTPRTVNLATYQNGYNNNNSVKFNNTPRSSRSYNNSNTNYSKSTYTPGSTNNSNRSYTPSTESRSSSSGSSNSGTITRPNHGR